MKKVLITGIDSFTGVHLSSYFESFGYDVCGTSLFGGGHKKYKCDITKKSDIEAVVKEVSPDFVIHLSGISFAAHSNNEEFYRVNTIGAINILEVLNELDVNPKKVIMASSATVYGNQGLEVLDESLCPKPANHYGASKYAMESLSANYFDKLDIVIVRPFNYTGIGQAEHFLIPKIVKHFREKKDIIELGNLHVSREFNDVGFVCEAYGRLLQSDASSIVLNIASNRGIKLLDAVGAMSEIAGYEIEVKVNPAFVREGEIRSLTGSNARLFDTIGEIPQKEFKETLADMYNSMDTDKI